MTEPQLIRLSVVPQRAPEVSRSIEFLDSATLAEVGESFRSALDLRSDARFAFFMSDTPWHEVYELPLVGESEGERDAGKKRLRNLNLHVGYRFLYLFNYVLELLHDVTVDVIGPIDPSASYPRVVASRGQAPPEDEENPQVDDDLVPLVAALAESMDDPHPDDESRTLRDAELVRRCCSETEGRRVQMVAIVDALDEKEPVEPVVIWLTEVPLRLAAIGRVDDGWSLLESIHAALDYGPPSVADRMRLLEEAGRNDEARVARDTIIADPSAKWDQLREAAETSLHIGDFQLAQGLFRRVLLGDATLLAGDKHRLLGRLVNACEAADDLEGARAARDEMASIESEFPDMFDAGVLSFAAKR